MNKTTIKDKEVKLELVLAILTQAIEISNNTSADIFTDYFSHVNGFNVRTYWNGWGNDEKVNINTTVYLDQDCIETLEEILNKLNMYYKEETR